MEFFEQKQILNEIIYNEYFKEKGMSCIDSLYTEANTSMFNDTTQMSKLIEKLKEFNNADCANYIIESLYDVYETTQIFIAYGDLVKIAYQYELSVEALSILRPQLFVYEYRNHSEIKPLVEQKNCFVGYNDSATRWMISSNYDENDFEENKDYYINLVKNCFYIPNTCLRSKSGNIVLNDVIRYDCEFFMKVYLKTKIDSNNLQEAIEILLNKIDDLHENL